ncbi:MAG: pilus assembly PilX N-terminal domain-containing protein [Deltaproteobacteria bacterium]|nr:pilus assembly PilX N-terminal domain-containing protein [Deltaproteobacteria bacterium]
MNTLNNEKGTILVTMLILMVIVTLIGVLAINTSTVDIQISGNLKRSSRALARAEAGIDLAIPIIESTLWNGQLTTSSSSITTTMSFPSGFVGTTGTLDDTDSVGLGAEITFGPAYHTDTPSSGADILITNLNGVAVNVDIDRLYATHVEGSGIESAAGYEGIGGGLAAGGAAILYSIDSQGTI